MLIPPLRSALLGTLSLLASVSLAQNTLPVGPGQTYTTIQSAINAANPGDTVLVAPGTYNENINFNGKAITVTSSAGPAVTILDGGSVAPAVTFTHGETSASLISGFTIQHGGAFTNYAPGSNSPPVGSINITGSSPTIADNIITLSNCWGIVSNYSSGHGAPSIRNNTISATQDKPGGCSITGGAAIVIWGGLSGPGFPTGYYGGLIYGNTLENNADAGMEVSGGNGGAGIVLWGGGTVVANNIIRNNASPGGTGGAIHIGSNDINLIYQNLIYGNSAGCGGGALSTTGQGVYVINNTIVDNTSTNNAGYSNCIDIAQIYPSPDTYGTGNPSDVFLNNIISGSTSYPAVNCSWTQVPDEANQPTFQYNILYNAGGPFFGNYCIDVSGKYNNIAADPQFTDPANHNYTLKSTSPAIDAGQNSVLDIVKNTYHQLWTRDFAGNPRVAEVTGNGCNIDIGAYEYPSTSNDCGISETLTSSLNPAQEGQSVTFTAQLTTQTGSPTGLIEFLDGTNLLASQAVSTTGSAAFITNTLSVGSHTITANYQPTGAFAAATASLSQLITGLPTATALTCLPSSIPIGGTAQLTASVTSPSGTPTGYIAFADNGTTMANLPLLADSVSFAYNGASAGSHTLTVTYFSNGAFAPSSATCQELVTLLPSTSTLSVTPASSTYGLPVTLAAEVAPTTPPGPGTPTGAVTFFNGTSPLGAASLTAGVATLAPISLPVGSYNLSCNYPGSTTYATSSCAPVSISVIPASTALTLTSSMNPAPTFTPVTFTVRLTSPSQPAGAGNTLLLSLNGQSIPLITDATGIATYTVASLPAGSYPVTAAFAATPNLLATSAALSQLITADPTSTALTASLNPGDINQAVALTATVTSQTAQHPTGSVTFFNGATPLGSSPLSSAGTTTLTPTFPTATTFNLTAVYHGDANFSPSTSPVFLETIVAGDFSIQLSPGNASLYTGLATQAQLTVSSLRGFSQPLALACTGLPAYATCTFSPTSLPNGQGSATVILQTAAPHKTSAGPSTLAATLAALSFFLLPGFRRRRRFLSGLAVLLLAVAIGISACGSPSPISAGTPPGTYHVAITAKASEISHSAPFTLTVKSLF